MAKQALVSPQRYYFVKSKPSLCAIRTFAAPRRGDVPSNRTATITTVLFVSKDRAARRTELRLNQVRIQRLTAKSTCWRQEQTQCDLTPVLDITDRTEEIPACLSNVHFCKAPRPNDKALGRRVSGNIAKLKQD